MDDDATPGTALEFLRTASAGMRRGSYRNRRYRHANTQALFRFGGSQVRNTCAGTSAFSADSATDAASCGMSAVAGQADWEHWAARP